MSRDRKWIGWNKPLAVLSLMSAAFIAGVYLWRTGKAPKPVFDFDDGTSQGWTGDGIFDDAGNKYDGGLYKVGHAEQHQYPGNFPCPPHCDPLNDKKGSLCLSIAELQPSLSQFNFPSNSTYWEAKLVSPFLSKLFQNKTEFCAYVGDMFGVQPGHIRAAMLLKVDIGGTLQQLLPVGGVTEQVVSKDQWTKVSAKFSVPANASVRNIVVRIRGDWQSYKLYEGAIFVDHVGAVA
jgi:hypothetical protein